MDLRILVMILAPSVQASYYRLWRILGDRSRAMWRKIQFVRRPVPPEPLLMFWQGVVSRFVIKQTMTLTRICGSTMNNEAASQPGTENF
jgi:hypothetical protein